MREGLRDEFQIMVNPIVLGNGTPLFKGLPERAKLKLVNTRQLESGTVVHFYKEIAAQ